MFGKRLLKYLRLSTQAYERREISVTAWIQSQQNSAGAHTKVPSKNDLDVLINHNKLHINNYRWFHCSCIPQG